MEDKHQPLVSVILPCYNGEKFIAEAIESVLNQTYDNWELIIVDDGSTDNSKDIVKKYLTDNRIQYIEHKENKGIPSARNTGIKASKGEYIALLDQDDLWVNNRLSAFVKKYKTLPPQVGLVYSDIKIVSDGNNKKRIKKANYKKIQLVNKKKFINRLFEKNFIRTVSQVIIRKECFDKIGYFDERLQGSDDYDFWIRVASKYDFAFLDEPLTLYLLHEDNSSKRIKYNMIKEEMNIILSKAIKDNPFLIKNIKYERSYLLYKYGIKLLEENKIMEAKSYFLRSLKENSLNLKAWLRYIMLLNKKYLI